MSAIETSVGVETLVVTFALVALAMVACIIVGRCIQNARFIRTYRRDVVQRFSALRIRKMLETLGVSQRRYMGKALSVDVEKHLRRCGHCPNTDACDHVLRERDLSKVDEICPNYKELLSYRPKRLGNTSIR